MYKLLIVDDEYVEIEALEFVIKNSTLPITTIITATNGRTAIKIANDCHPDFILMDIKMPGISGTEAATIIKDAQPTCKIVFLSAYNYFNYAKEAIQINASDFLIKPVPDEELIAVLNRLIVETNKESLAYDNQISIESKFKQISSFFENELINYLLFSDIKKEQILEYFNALNCHPTTMHVLVMAFNDNSFSELSSLKETVLKRRSLKLIKEHFLSSTTHCFGNYNKNYIYMLLIVDTPLSKDTATKTLNKINQSINERFYLSNHVILSNTFSDVMDINTTLLHHKHELLYNHNQKTIVFPSITAQTNKPFSNKKEQLLLEAIKLNNTAQSLSISKEYVQWLENQSLSVPEIRFNLYGLLSFIIKSVGDAPPHTQDELNKLITIYRSKLNNITNKETLYSCFIDQLLTVSTILKDATPLQSSSVIQQLCRYIDTHFREDLTLKYLAKEVHMNSQYISKLFKEEMGITFSDYLTDVRINKAKELLVDTNQSIQDIGIYVGYNDPNYFTRAFKKRESITPKTYRKKATALTLT